MEKKQKKTKKEKGGWALVTGASSGIGKACAQILSSWGYDLVLVARRLEYLEDLKTDLQNNRPEQKIELVSLDLSLDGAADRVFSFCSEKKITPVWLVNNAGFGDWGSFSEADGQKLSDMIRVNCLALTELTRRFLPSMIEAGWGRILNVGSVAGFMPGPLMAVYYATKAFVISLSQALDRELQKTKVRVSVLCPGPVKTEFAQVARLQLSQLMSKAKPGAYEVALYGLKANRRGKRLAVYGFFYKTMIFLLRFSPRGLLLGVIERLQAARKP